MEEKTIKNLKPNDVVKVCPYIEHGVYFAIDGVHCCVNGTMYSPLIARPEELKENILDYQTIIKRRKEIFASINNLNSKDAGCCKSCCNLIEKKYKDVNFEILGGKNLAGGMGIQHYTTCNYKCSYCCY